MATKTLEKRVSDLEESVDDIPRLLSMRFEYVRAQLDLVNARLSALEAKVDAMPRVIAEMLDERDKRSK